MIFDLIDIFDTSLAFRFLGILGFLLYVGTFTALQLRWIDGNSITYTCASVLAASLVLTSMTIEFNLASALIQIVWIVVGICGIVLRLTKLQRSKKIREEISNADSNASIRPIGVTRVSSCRRRLAPSNQNFLEGRTSRPNRHRRS